MNALSAICIIGTLIFGSVAHADDGKQFVERLESRTGNAVLDLSGTSCCSADKDGKPRIYGISGLVTAEPATYAAGIKQFAGAALGLGDASNSRYLYIYRLDQLARENNRNAQLDRVQTGYVFAPAKGGNSLVGVPVVIKGDIFKDIENGKATNSAAFTETINWALSPGKRQNWDVGKPLYIGFSEPIPGLQWNEKVLAKGSEDWNVYNDPIGVDKAAR